MERGGCVEGWMDVRGGCVERWMDVVTQWDQCLRFVSETLGNSSDVLISEAGRLIFGGVGRGDGRIYQVGSRSRLNRRHPHKCLKSCKIRFRRLVYCPSQNPVCMRTHKKDPVVHVRVWWITETGKDPSMHL